jgi:hypothetical protein
LQALGRFEEAETKLKESLDIRIESLGPYDDMTVRTHRILASLYMEWDSKEAEATRSLQKMFSAARKCTPTWEVRFI